MGLPVLALLGILDAGRGIAAPPAIGGDWIVEFKDVRYCPIGVAVLRQPALSISQSGTEAIITVNDGSASAITAVVKGTTLSGGSIHATILGKPGEHTMEGRISLDGCTPAEFRAFRQASRKRGE